MPTTSASAPCHRLYGAATTVWPSWWLMANEPKVAHSVSAATTAPTSWAAMYIGASTSGSRRVAASAIVTPGLKCAPDIAPNA